MNKDFKKKCCENCKHGNLLSGKCEKLNNLAEYKALCSEEIQKASIFNSKFLEKQKIKEEYCCDDYENYWLEYPIAVKKVECSEITYNRYIFGESGSLVKIRPCNKAYGDKTYLGFLLGDLPLGITQSYDPKTNVLKISASTNPAIFVPELKKIIFGSESWWGKIANEKQLKEISDNDIDNVWYVRMLKAGEANGN